MKSWRIIETLCNAAADLIADHPDAAAKLARRFASVAGDEQRREDTEAELEGERNVRRGYARRGEY